RNQLDPHRLAVLEGGAVQLPDQYGHFIFVIDGTVRVGNDGEGIALGLEIRADIGDEAGGPGNDLVEDVSAPFLGGEGNFPGLERAPDAGPGKAGENRGHHRIVVNAGVEFQRIVELENRNHFGGRSLAAFDLDAGVGV